ncbi:hypothetical protein ACP4OV_002724 [Aristida adscensionis]
MRTSVPFAAAVLIVAVVAAADVRADLATIESTCRAAAAAALAADKILPFISCKHHLSRHPGAANADVPGLARIAAVLGAGNADAARAEAGRLAGSSGDPRYRGALERCAQLFGAARAAFAAAEAAIVARRYAAVREQLTGVPELGHGCHARVDRASPFMNYIVNNTLYAHMCMAIAGLVNIR